MTQNEFFFFWREESPFSQWYPASFIHSSIEFKTAEHFMMYAKAHLFDDMEAAVAIITAPTPMEAKAIGRRVRNFNKKAWDDLCRRYVFIGSREKFLQNPVLLKTLLETDGKELVEASPYDRIWGIGLKASDPRALNKAQWRGTNWLGEVLTRLRMEILSGAIWKNMDTSLPQYQGALQLLTTHYNQQHLISAG